MSWARKIFGPKSSLQSATASLDARKIPVSSSPDLSANLHMNVGEPSFETYKRARAGVTPEWCKTAFKFERNRLKQIKTDWGFVTPLWILMGLVCLIPQVAILQWAFTSLA